MGVLNIVGGEIMTFPDTLTTTQGLSLWSLNIVGGEILRLTFPESLHESLSLGSPYSGVIPMVFEHSVIGNGNIKCNHQMGLYMSSD